MGKTEMTLHAAAADRRRQLDGIQYLRGIAALLVILSHASLMMRYPRYFGESPTALSKAGVFGVAIFFVISGFIITYIAQNTDGSGRDQPRDFLLRRFVRIVPFTVLCVLGYNVMSYVGTGNVEVAPMLRALVLWPVGELKPNVVWSLRHEAFFYLLFAACILVAHRRPLVLAAWCLAPILAAGVMHLGSPLEPFIPPTLQELLMVLFVGGDTGANLQFGTGMLLGLGWIRAEPWMLRVRRDQAPVFESPLIPAILVLAISALGTGMIEWAALPDLLVRQLVWTLIATGIVWSTLVIMDRARGRVGWLILLGDASFSLYLVHNPVLLTLFEITRHIRDILPPLVFWVLYVALTLIIGVLVHRWVEVPLIRRIGRRLIAR